MVPNDVVIALGNGASVGKAGEEKGGSRYQESVAEAEWDFLFFFILRESGGAVMLGCGSSTHVGRRQLGRPAFAYWFSLRGSPHSKLVYTALPATRG